VLLLTRNILKQLVVCLIFECNIFFKKNFDFDFFYIFLYNHIKIIKEYKKIFKLIFFQNKLTYFWNAFDVRNFNSVQEREDGTIRREKTH
jgi:hypothetical protein